MHMSIYTYTSLYMYIYVSVYCDECRLWDCLHCLPAWLAVQSICCTLLIITFVRQTRSRCRRYLYIIFNIYLFVFMFISRLFSIPDGSHKNEFKLYCNKVLPMLVRDEYLKKLLSRLKSTLLYDKLRFLFKISVYYRDVHWKTKASPICAYFLNYVSSLSRCFSFQLVFYFLSLIATGYTLV